MDAVATMLSAIGRGESRHIGELYSLLYPDLLRLARSRSRRCEGPEPMDPSALVHESYLRFAASAPVGLRDRGHFMAYAARIMRSVVIDAARRRRRDRHGGDAVHVEFDDETLAVVAEDDRESGPARRVHESLEELAAVDARLARVVEMRYFTGMTEPEIAGALGIAVRTVARDWEKARAFLQVCLS